MWWVCRYVNEKIISGTISRKHIRRATIIRAHRQWCAWVQLYNSQKHLNFLFVDILREHKNLFSPLEMYNIVSVIFKEQLWKKLRLTLRLRWSWEKYFSHRAETPILQLFIAYIIFRFSKNHTKLRSQKFIFSKCEMEFQILCVATGQPSDSTHPSISRIRLKMKCANRRIETTEKLHYELWINWKPRIRLDKK